MNPFFFFPFKPFALTLLMLFTCSAFLFSQNVGINNDGSPPDPSAMLDVKSTDKGLLIVLGCAHAGIINTVKHCLSVTGSEKVYAVLGGFHLSGANQSNVESTISEMQAMGPKWIVPMHCTGWRETNIFAAAMPDQFLLNSVGTTYVFSSASD